MKILLLVVLPLYAFSQQPVSISGRILDKTSQEALPFATVTLHPVDSDTILAGSITDENGRFQLSGVFSGNYNLHCSLLGFQPKDITLFIGEINNIIDVGKVELEAQAEQLQEVVVTESRGTVSSGLDRKSFAMDNQIAQSGGSVLDAMKGLPGITVDQDGKVLLRGSDQVAILMDGKQSSLTGFGNQRGLANIPAANIDRIEIINNPSAKYDASGMAGIINIIYKKEQTTGWNGELGFAFGLGALGKRKPDNPSDLGSYSVTPKFIPSLSLNHRAPKTNIWLQSEILRQKKLPNNEFTTRHYTDGLSIISQVPENRTQTQYIVKSGVDWSLNDRNTLSLSGIWDYEHHIDTSQIPYIDLNTRQRYRYWHWKEDEVTGFLNFRLDYKHRFPEAGHELNASMQYTRGWEDEQYFLNDSSAIRQSTDRTHIVAIENTTAIQLDYIKPLRSGRLEAGTKLQFRTIPVTYEIGRGEASVIAPGLGEWSDWGENIIAGYLNYIFEQSSFDIEAGLRTEQTNVFYDIDPANIYYPRNDAYDYFEWYPNVRFTFKINEINNLSLFYNRRVDRPGEPELRIFPKYDDPELLKVGNPYLRPQFTQNFEVAYKRIWELGSLYFSTYYRLINDPFQRVFAFDGSDQIYNVINRVYQNVGSGTNLGLEVLWTQSVSEHWKLSASMNLYENKIDAYSTTLLFPTERPWEIDASSDQTWDIKMNHQFFLPHQLQLQLSGVYLAPKNIPQGRQFARSSVDIGVQKEIMQGKGKITLAVTDLFNRYGIKQEIAGPDFTAVYENFYETQSVRLGFTYKWQNHYTKFGGESEMPTLPYQ